MREITLSEKHRIIRARGNDGQARFRKVAARNGFPREDQRLFVGGHSHGRLLKALIAFTSGR